MNTAADAALRDALAAGARRLAFDLTDEQSRRLLDYLGLIQRWNKVYNLTAVRDPAEMLTHHLLDSLAVVGPLRRQLAGAQAGQPGLSIAQGPVKLLDVGAGAGLPGVVIAICCPEISVTCVDTVAKKAAFIQQVAAALRLPNLRGLHARVETLDARRDGGYDVVSSRAFASLADFTTWSRAALKGGEGPGVWMAMKGRHPADEIATVPADVDVFHVEQLAVPGLDAERCLVWLRAKP